MKDFHPDSAEDNTRKKLELLGETVTVRVYVNVNHAGNLENRMSHSWILIYFSELINFYSKINYTVESSICGTEFVTLRIVTDMVE